MPTRVGLYNIDSTMPNIALMKISTFFKGLGHTVRWYLPIEYDLHDAIYVSSIFTWSNMEYCIGRKFQIGGTGHNIVKKLPDIIDDCALDYSLYPDYKQAVGFLTRGCIRSCPECFVPIKEGPLQAYRDIESVAVGRKEVVLFDNNVLASPHGIKQIEKIIDMGLKIDFNQGMDARLIDDDIADLLARVKWIRFIRMACDSVAMVDPVIEAVEKIRKYSGKKGQYFVYVLVKDIESAHKRCVALKSHGIDPFAQPYRNIRGDEPSQIQKRFARWVNHKEIFKSVKWEDYT